MYKACLDQSPGLNTCMIFRQIQSLMARQHRFFSIKLNNDSSQLVHLLHSETGYNNELSFNVVKNYLHKLQANRSTFQSQIAKLSTYYRNLDSELIESNVELLNSVIYFASIFTKNVPERFLKIVLTRSELLNNGVLLAFAQKLLRSNQWPVAEKIISNKFKFQSPEAELMKFEVLALNGNYKKMKEQLTYLAKSDAIPKKIQFKLLCLLNSNDGLEVFDEKIVLVDGCGDRSNENFQDWNRLLQLSLKGKLLSLYPQTLEVFLRQLVSIAQPNFINPKLLFLAFRKCENKNGSELTSEAKGLLELIYKQMSAVDLLKLAYMLRGQNIKAPEEVFTLCLLTLDQIVKNNKDISEDIVLNTTLCWIIRNNPRKYSYNVLMKDFACLLDLAVAEVAVESIGLYDRSVIKFVEFCMMEKNIFFKREMLKKIVDVASEQFEYFPSKKFMQFIRQKGYTLSPQFYLKSLQNAISKNTSDIENFNDCYGYFKLIPADELHGDLFKQYLRLTRQLLDFCLCFSNIDQCFKIYTTISKYERTESLENSEKFSEFILKRSSSRKFMENLQVTINMNCIKAAIECVHKTTSTLNSSSVKLNERFCAMALQVCLCKLDFETAHKIHSYMKNEKYCDGGFQFSQNVLSQWLKAIIK